MDQKEISAEDVILREVIDSDLPILFENQLDPAANYMAAFTAENPADREAFIAHWAKIRANERNIIRTILFDGKVVGSISNFEMFGKSQIGYWIGKEYWGKGIATKAVLALLDIVTARPIYAQAAKDNLGSIRVLEKCGFKVIAHERGFSNARGEEIDEVVTELK